MPPLPGPHPLLEPDPPPAAGEPEPDAPPDLTLAVRSADADALRARIVELATSQLGTPATRRAYRRGMDAFLAWAQASGRRAFSANTVEAFVAHLRTRGRRPATINQHLAAIRHLAAVAYRERVVDRADLDDIREVRGARHAGGGIGTWLTRDQAQQLLDVPDPRTLRGKRDQALLAVLLGCGLRRSELVALELRHIQQREGRWVIVDLVGKGGKLRVVPMAAAIKASIDRWTRAAGISEGRVFRRLRKGGRVLEVGIDDQTVADVLQHAARPLAVAAAAADPTEAALWHGLAPHDCRRTYAKLTRKAEAPLEQIQLTLGHQSLTTTQKYLGTEVDYHDAPSDRLRFHLRSR
jgi:site-specific recombinase XerD